MALFNFLKKKEEIAKNAEKARAGFSPKENPPKEEAITFRKNGFIPQAPIAVLIAPHITEKSNAATGNGCYTFRVEKNATSMRVKEAIEKTYKVHVTDVHLIALPAKKRRRGLTKSHNSGYKKAIVSLKKGEHIDLF